MWCSTFINQGCVRSFCLIPPFSPGKGVRGIGRRRAPGFFSFPFPNLVGEGEHQDAIASSYPPSPLSTLERGKDCVRTVAVLAGCRGAGKSADRLSENRSESVSRVLCPLRVAVIPLGHRLLCGSCDHTRGLKSGPLSLLFGLAPDGVWHARTITRAPVGSYPTISPLPLRAVYFLCHFPRVAPRRR